MITEFINLNFGDTFVRYIPRSKIPGVWGLCCASAESLQSCPTPCDYMGCRPPGSSVHGILKARTLEQVSMHPPRVSSIPGIKSMSLMSPALVGRFLTISATWEVVLFTYSEALKISPFFREKFNHFTFSFSILYECYLLHIIWTWYLGSYSFK